jgi:hypothetical protein
LAKLQAVRILFKFKIQSTIQLKHEYWHNEPKLKK